MRQDAGIRRPNDVELTHKLRGGSIMIHAFHLVRRGAALALDKSLNKNDILIGTISCHSLIHKNLRGAVGG